MKRGLITETCLRRPVSTAMAFTVLVALGIASVFRIPLETYPEVSYPRLSLTASWPGASPQAMEAFITSRLEAEATTLPGIEEVTSTSSPGSATVNLKLAPDTNMDFVQLELNEKLARLRTDLPERATVSVRPYVPREVQQEFLLDYTYTGPYHVNELQRFAEEFIQRPLALVEGIARVSVSGGERRQVRIELDPAKVESLGLTPSEVAARLRPQPMVQTVGQVSQGAYRFNLVLREELRDLDDFREVIVAQRGSRYIQLSEIGRVVDGYPPSQNIQRLDGHDRIAIRINAVAGSNIIEVARRIKERLEAIAPELPPGTRLIENRDNSAQMQRELNTLRFRSVIIVGLIFLVLLLFLRGVANPLIILSSIATSVLLTIGLFYFLGGSLNLMSLAGLAMGFGLMVDNSIVVLDNIHRYRDRGSGRLAAARAGTADMILPILAGTGTTIIVFLPFLYLQGELQAVYVPFALAVVTSLACSLLVAFTLIPSLAARLLPAREGEGDPWAEGDLEREARRAGLAGAYAASGAHAGPRGPENIYQRTLRWMLRPWPKVVIVLLVIGVFSGSYMIFNKKVTKGRIWGWGPQVSEVLSIGISAPTGSDMAVMTELVRQVEERIQPLHEAGLASSYETTISPTSGRVTVSFPDEVIAQGIPYLIKDQMIVFAGTMGGVRVYVSGFGDGFSAGGFGVQGPTSSITLLGYNYSRLRELAERLADRLAANPRVRREDIDIEGGGGFGGAPTREVVLRLDRGKLAEYGLSVAAVMAEVGAQVRTDAAGGRFSFRGDEVDFLVKVEGFESRNVVDLFNATVPIGGGGRVRMGEIASLDVERTIPSIQRLNQQYQRTVRYEFRGPAQMAQRFREEILDNTILPNGYEIRTTQYLFQTREEERHLLLVILFSVLLVYMLTAALYESFFHPFSVITTVPLALIGVFLGYWLFQRGFDRSAYIGVVLMGGIVVNNAIILVDHINALRRFLPRRDAVVRAARERARPILMTTLTTVVGLMPLLIGAQEGRDFWYTLAFTICVALPVATLFTLGAIPLVYELIDTSQTFARRTLGALVLAVRRQAATQP